MSHIWSMIFQRLALGVLTLFIVSLIIFGATELLPGDFAQEILGQSATPETVAALREKLGLDQPMHTRYLGWLGDIVTGDFGESLANGQPVADLIGKRLGYTLYLALYAAAIAVPLSLALGILAALFRNTFFDRAANASAKAKPKPREAPVIKAVFVAVSKVSQVSSPRDALLDKRSIKRSIMLESFLSIQELN